MIPEDWKKIQLPLGLTVSIALAVIGAFLWVDNTYVHAEDLVKMNNNLELRLLQTQKRSLETEVLKLEVKKEAYPEKFDAVDKAVLEKHKEELKETKVEEKAARARTLPSK